MTNWKFIRTLLLSTSILVGAPGVRTEAQPLLACDPILSEVLPLSGERTVFTGIDHLDRTFSLTQDPTTGAWALLTITYQEKGDGVQIGTPCVVAAGAASKLLFDSPLPLESRGQVADSGTDESETAETLDTYRVTSLRGDDDLDLRTGPGTDYPSILPIPPDTTGVIVDACKEVSGYRHPWCETTWQGKQGWASACCLINEKTGRRAE
jgi:hypothetical protein